MDRQAGGVQIRGERVRREKGAIKRVQRLLKKTSQNQMKHEGRDCG